MGVLARLGETSRPEAVALVARQISNVHAAQAQGLLAINAPSDEAARIVADGFLQWVVTVIRADENPEAAAREFCRELLARVCHRPPLAAMAAE